MLLALFSFESPDLGIFGSHPLGTGAHCASARRNVHCACAATAGGWVVNIQGLLRGQVLVSLTMQLTEADAVIDVHKH